MPNDEDEKERLDIIHAMMLEMMGGKLFLAPISRSPRHVLDLGTGTGLWAIDFGTSFRSVFYILSNFMEFAGDKFPRTEVRIRMRGPLFVPASG